MKKMIDKPVAERMAFWIPADHYQPVQGQQVLVDEKKDDGLANVSCTLPSSHAYELTLEGKHVAHLNSQRCTDGILLLEHPSGSWELHIIECKRTVNRNKWRKTKLQFEASIQRAMAVATGVGIFPAKIKLYTAVRNEEIRDEIMASPVLSKITPADRDAFTPEELEKYHFFDWFDPTLELWVNDNIPHEIIPLDDQGVGNVQIQFI
ncbi:MAG TPA: hypothetical protein VFV52_13640 [Bacilli bacterium]|nr:hypothetical protein [Bacilli bacterium]